MLSTIFQSVLAGFVQVSYSKTHTTQHHRLRKRVCYTTPRLRHSFLWDAAGVGLDKRARNAPSPMYVGLVLVVELHRLLYLVLRRAAIYSQSLL